MPIEELVEKMLTQIIAALSLSSNVKHRVCVIINNLGTVSALEMGVIGSTVNESLGELSNNISLGMHDT